MGCLWFCALSTSDGWFLFFMLWLKGELMFTAFNRASSISQALPIYCCPTEKAFFLSGFIILWSTRVWKSHNSRNASMVLAIITPAIPISGDCHPPEYHRPLPFFLIFFAFRCHFSNNWWRKEHWLLTQLGLLHRSTTHGKTKVQLRWVYTSGELRSEMALQSFPE